MNLVISVFWSSCMKKLNARGWGKNQIKSKAAGVSGVSQNLFSKYLTVASKGKILEKKKQDHTFGKNLFSSLCLKEEKKNILPHSIKQRWFSMHNLTGKDVSLSNLSCQSKGHIFVLINNAHTLDVLHSCVNARMGSQRTCGISQPKSTGLSLIKKRQFICSPWEKNMYLSLWHQCRNMATAPPHKKNYTPELCLVAPGALHIFLAKTEQRFAWGEAIQCMLES